MEHTFKKPRFTRLASLLLALAMVLSMFPVTAFAAEESYVRITDKDGNDAYRFDYGEPIMVTAAASAGDWVGLYDDYYDGSRTGSWYWYYTNAAQGTDEQSFTSVNGGTYNIYNGVCYDSAKEDEYVPAGVYFVETGNKDARQMVVVGEQIMQLEKYEFKYGEPIKVTVPESVGLHADAWIGIYTKEYNTTKNSCYWNYVSSLNAGASLFDRGVNDEGDLFLPGEYVLVFSNDTNYNVLDIVEITITDEFVEDLIVKTEATCDAPGKIEYLNFATKAPIADLTETLPQKNHAYDTTKWVFDAATKTHSHVCTNDASHKTDTDNCTPNEGVVKTPAEGANAGTKEFTCTVCGGKWEEEYFLDKYVVNKEQTKNPTCEEDGQYTITWSDGSVTYESIDKLNHNYTGAFGYDTETDKHWRTCVNDPTHKTEAQDCVFTYKDEDGKRIYSCECGNSYEEELVFLTTNDTEYKYGESILVSVDTTNYTPGENAWIGFYKEDDVYGSAADGGVEAIYWNYLSKIDLTGENVIDPGNFGGGARLAPEFAPGETYVVYLFADGGYIELDRVTFTVTNEFVEDLVERTEATCTQPGSVTYKVHNGNGAIFESLTETSAAKEHSYTDFEPTYTVGEVGNKDDNTKYTHTHSCTRECGEEGATETVACSFAKTGSEGLMDTYTCSVCEGTVIVDTSKVEEKRETVAPKCTEQGYTLITYKDGTTDKVDYVPALGHDFEGVAWTHVEDTNTHTRSCKRGDDCDKGEGYVQTADCADTTPEVDPDVTANKVNFACECGNKWSEDLVVLMKQGVFVPRESNIYKTNEDALCDYVAFTLNKAYFEMGCPSGQWLGIFKMSDVESESFEGTALHWVEMSLFTSHEGSHFDILDPGAEGTNKGKSGIPAGEYALVLFKDGGYEPLTYKTIIVHTCADKNPEDHLCDVCEDKLTICTDTVKDGDHNCDTCDKPMDGFICTDENKDHKCDECGYEMSKHEDANKDHKCDNGCTVDIGEHKDANKDHKCDYGCSVAIGTCEDKNNDGKCDYGCDKEFEVEPTEPDATEPKPTEPDATEPDSTEPDATEPEAPKAEGVTRLAGADRLVTSELIANQLKEKMGVEKFQNIIVASGGTFADALPGSYLAAVKNAPILLTLSKQKFIDQTATYIKANLAEGGTVYILGGESAVPAAMEKALEGINVKRVAGADRFGTNLAILKEAGVKSGDEILVCTAKEFADSLSAAATGKPILLVYKKITDEQKAYLQTLSGNTFCVVGGTTAVPENLEDAMKAYGEVSRLAGKDRLDTSVLVAEKYFPDATSSVVAYGWDFPDGLCGGSLAYATKSPLILAHSKEKLAQFTADYTVKAGLNAGYVLGGAGLVDDAATRAIFGMGNEAITQIK